MLRKTLVFVLLVFISLLFSYQVSAQTFYSWDIYENLELDNQFNITNSGNYEVADSSLYTSILSDLQSNLSEYGVEKYEFIYYFRWDGGAGAIRSPILRFGNLSPISADTGTGSIVLNESSSNGVYPFSFTIPADKIGLFTPRLQFYCQLSSGATEFDFTLTGISCKAIRTAPPSDVRLLEQINNNTFAVNYVLALIVALLICWMAVKLIRGLFRSFS